MPELLRKITLNHNGERYCMNCLFSFTTKEKLEPQSVCKNHDYCYMVMLEEAKNILMLTHACDNNPEESSTREISKCTACGYSLFTHCSFDSSESELNFYRGADCLEKFCADIKDHAAEIINYGEKEMLPLTDEEIESYSNQKSCHLQKEDLSCQ